MAEAAACQNPTVPQLENEKFTLGRIIKRGSERPNARILIGKSETCFAFIGGNQVEVAEFGDIAPSACNLAIGNTITIVWNRFDEFWNCTAVEDAVAKITEHDSVDRRVLRQG